MYKKGHYSVKILRMTSLLELDLYLKMLFNEVDASLQKLSICDNADAAAGDTIPMCQPCFAGDTMRKAWSTSYNCEVL